MVRPIDISRGRRFTMPLAFVGAMLAATYVFAMGYSHLIESDTQQSAQTAANARQIADHEQRLRNLEGTNARIDEKLDRLLEMERGQQRR